MGRVILTSETEITPPAVAPLELAFVRKHLKSISTAEDELIESWIASAGLYFREMTGRELITTTREYWLEQFPTAGVRLELPRPPLQSVVSVSYLAADGSLLTYTDGGSPDLPLYDVMAPAGPYARPGHIVVRNGVAWPIVTTATLGAVRIRYICGYGDAASDMPDLIKTTLCALIGSFDQFRSETHTEATTISRLPFGIDLLMDGFKSSALRSTVPRSSWP